MNDIADIREFEERAINAWPAFQSIIFGGWVLRLSKGYTKRANSVNAINPTAPFDDVRAASERLYARHGLPAIFRLSPLATPEADKALANAGYSIFDPSLVLFAPLSGGMSDGNVRIEEAPSAAWLDGFAAANEIAAQDRAIHDRMVSLIAMPTAFATLIENERAIGFGLAVYERGAVGLFDIVVVPPERGRGNGRKLTNALLQWGWQTGAQKAYLQVRERNTGAHKLYTGLGFREAYRYHYRVPNSALSVVS
jgi:N-acetylglutamate synthase